MAGQVGLWWAERATGRDPHVWHFTVTHGHMWLHGASRHFHLAASAPLPKHVVRTGSYSFGQYHHLTAPLHSMTVRL